MGTPRHNISGYTYTTETCIIIFIKYKPLIQVKKDLTRWSTLPVSFLLPGLINVIKMITLPRILYILSMSFLQFSLNDLKVINYLISKLIWAGRKPKIKLV